MCVRGWNGKRRCSDGNFAFEHKERFCFFVLDDRNDCLFHVKGCIVGKKEFFIIIISLLSKFYKFENKSRVERCSNFIIEKVSFFRLR